MTASDPMSPGPGSSPERPDPLSMSVAEKLACEWEARHDVIARGGRLGDPAAVARYFTHTRCEDTLHGVGTPHEHQLHHGGQRAGWTPQEHLRSWFRWGEDTR
jgi:hypothetical protein